MSLLFNIRLWHLTFLLLLQFIYLIICMRSRIIILILIFAVHCKEYFYSPLNLYISDNNYSSIFHKVAQRKEQIGILFTNKYCRQCHRHQPELTNIILRVWKQFKMQIYRCQLPNSVALQELFNIKRFPMLHFVIPYHSSYLIYPNYDILTLDSANKIVSKIQHSLHKYELTLIQRSNAIYLNEQKLFFIEEDEMRNLYDFNPVFLNLPNLIFMQDSQLQALLKSDSINEYQHINCLIYVKRQRKCYSPTSIHQVAYIFSLISYQKAIQFNEKTYKSYQQLSLNRYIFIAVLDSIFQRQKSKQYIDMLNKLLQKREFGSKITIFWMETQLNKQKLAHLGFKQTDRPPLFSQFDLTNAPKKILKDKHGKPIFNEYAITKFIKDIIKFDEKESITKWNEELLEESLQRLRISKEYKIIHPSTQITNTLYFVLSFPEIEAQLLGDNTIFYKMLLNYRYLIQRVNRFAQSKVQQNYLTFDKYGCNKRVNYGLYLIKQQRCIELSKEVIFSQEKISQTIQNIFVLPDLYWVNQDQYQSYLQEQQGETLPGFTFQYLDI